MPISTQCPEGTPWPSQSSSISPVDMVAGVASLKMIAESPSTEDHSFAGTLGIPNHVSVVDLHSAN
jgi:hypothetical protein